MGMFDSVNVECPKCKTLLEFQSKSGDCLLDTYTLDTCPIDVLIDVNRHAPIECPNCKSKVQIDFDIQVTRKEAIIVGD